MFDIGLKGAFNTTWLFNQKYGGDQPFDYDFTFGTSVGAGGTFCFGGKSYYSHPTLSYGFEVRYSTINQGYMALYDTMPIPYISKVHLNFIEIPLIIKGRTPSGLYGEIGPQFSSLISATADSSNSNPSSQAHTNVRGEYSTGNISLLLGIGFEADLSSTMIIMFGLRTTIGFTDMTYPEHGNGDYNPTNSFTAGFHIGISYKMDFFHDNH